MKKPKRCFTLELELGADTRDDLIKDLRHLIFEIKFDKLSLGQHVYGGTSSGGIFHFGHNPGMTHERYFEENDKFLALLKEDK